MPGRPDLSVGNLLPAALGGVAAALVTSGFGIAGSLIGAALAPVAYLLVKEVTRGPTERVVERAGPRAARRTEARVPVGVSSGAGEDTRERPPPAERVQPSARPDSDGQDRRGPAMGQVRRYRRRRWRWGYLAATAGLAFVIAVGVVTIPELITGSSLTTERRTTFFGDAPASTGSTSAPSDSTETTETTESPEPSDATDDPAPAESPTPTEAPSAEDGSSSEGETPPADDGSNTGEPLPAPDSGAPAAPSDPTVPAPVP